MIAGTNNQMSIEAKVKKGFQKPALKKRAIYRELFWCPIQVRHFSAIIAQFCRISNQIETITSGSI